MQTTDLTTWITHMMNLRGWSQAELARRTGVHQSQISKWSRGRAMPDRAHRNILAHAFGVPEADVHMLVGDTIAARSHNESPQRGRAHELIDVMDPDILADLLPIMERLVLVGRSS